MVKINFTSKKIEYKDKRKDNKIQYNRFINNIILLKLIIINLLLPNNNESDIIEFNSSSIKLKIKGTGFKNIFGHVSSFTFKRTNYADEIIINRINQKAINYSYNFTQTDNSVELIWNNHIDNCANMFRGCSDITEMDLSNFDTSQVTYMSDMFSDCTSLTSLNLLNFNTSKVTRMNYMFHNCTSLISLNISNFDTSQVTWMFDMFADCPLLTSLNLSNFVTSKVTRMEYMFIGCTKLEYINLLNFEDSQLQEYNNIFDKVPNNIVVCIFNTSNKIFQYIKENINCYNIYCLDDWKLHQKMIINDTGECIENYNNTDYKEEYNEKYYENLSYELINETSKCKLKKCLLCIYEAFSKNLCTKCNINYYPMENDPSNIGKYINCYNNLKGYYLDNDNGIYKKCYISCEICEISGNNLNHNCLKCNSNYPIKRNINNYINCYDKNDDHYFYSDYPILNDSASYKKYLDNIKNKIENITNNNSKNKNEIEEMNYYDKILKIIEITYTSENYNTSNLDNGNDEIIEAGKLKVTFITTKNEKNNMSTIYLGECENLIRKFYNITNNQSLYIKIVEVIQEGMKIPKIEYGIYSKVTENRLQKLNLSICINTKIYLSIPGLIPENLDILNSSSGYYNDICYVATSGSGTDISLKDRKNEFINKTLCQDDCEFFDYNFSSKKANCSCKIEESSLNFADIKINKTKLYKNFVNIKNIANIKILNCYKNLFSKIGILTNVGSYIISSIALFHIISFFIFYLNQKIILKAKINDIIFGIKNFDLLKYEGK